jgi:hypothetical protein
MLRPTPKEALAGIQRTITETLVPELKSPFAMMQAGTAAVMVASIANWLETFPAHTAAEIEDLKRTFDALRPHGESAILEAAGYREALESGMRASDEEPPDYNAMEAAMGELAGGVAIGRIAGPVASEVRGYIKRHLERLRVIFPSSSPFG